MVQGPQEGQDWQVLVAVLPGRRRRHTQMFTVLTSICPRLSTRQLDWADWEWLCSAGSPGL